MLLTKLLRSPSKSKKLTQDFYLRGDVAQIARMLLGKVLVSEIEGIRTAGIIVETEAYSGKNDRASHAYKNRRTERTRVMYEEDGRAYVYLIYGMYHLLNVVTNRAGKPDAVLIRAIEPLEGVEHMMARRKQKRVIPDLTNGPGKLTRALGITLAHYGVYLSGDLLWIEDRGIALPPHFITAGPRIGIHYAGEDAARPWRFWVKDNPFVSK
ncbi:3-methyladenine DNA glycosylase [Caldithrix abyssi DSM 13497]|uniref:Putative 3-methyladenine DNA glycosylase n=1 Tax=Caldithrix abyssi DSM 13497 TaxID=880073 RepID=H1XTI9_CALAY|nr:DNA-3-methyladenine glycosylase [Caldithrix abyssi]APF17349.1 DNA-3-methyladenine glycosylase [Caldithrix abyssi DSM 13497]EHO41464.1 3-methyladenine DNA glycosylase [Caldithrix abyssi DSM 13497]